MRLIGILAGCALTSVAGAQDMQAQLLEQVNVVRWQNGQLPPLKGQANLDQAAQGHSQAMGVRDFLAHCDLDTQQTTFQRLVAAGYQYDTASENIVGGPASAAAAVSLLMESMVYRNNILSLDFREIGNGYFLDSGDQNNVRWDGNGDCQADGILLGPFTHYWTQTFGRQDEVYPVVIAREAWQVDECLVDVYLYGTGWASHSRLSSDGSNWSAWQPFSANAAWDLSGAAGSTAAVHAQIRNADGEIRQARDFIRLGLNCGDVLFANGFQ